MSDNATVSAFTGPGPFSLPTLSSPRAGVTEDRMMLIKGVLPDEPGQTPRFVHIEFSLDEAMQLKCLLQRLQEIYGLPEPKGPILDRLLQ